ncbi:LytTR family transcriptional regulator [Parvularcula sp. ZS-1/3]|uniref:LytTR family transcriptional regulator n=1 Tax=Parvularcula mediterranea TaxID=2732508 RepID=A0A7Y3W5U1_9PROT|nr:LytTR family DNA-binding domain-containing protein [Parvularcula mediterranea]NNU16702.1 LytTR family transcriptional regulator [Parvularcula mediterranea]
MTAGGSRAAGGSGQREFLLQGLFALIVAIALGHAGPYGTYESMDLLPRIGFWVGVILLPWGLWQLLFRSVRSVVPGTVPWPLLMAALMVPFALIGSALTHGATLIALGAPLSEFPESWPKNVLLWVGFAYGVMLPLLAIGSALAKGLREEGGHQVASFLLHKLPPELRQAQLIALKAEDHYLRVFTSSGEDLIHMSLADALRALEGYPGVQTHRSWWVSLSDPAEIEPAANWETIAAANGLEIPVSRRRKADVRRLVEAAPSADLA